MAYNKLYSSSSSSGENPIIFHNAITSTATGTVWNVDLKADILYVEFITAGTFTAKFEGSFDGINWHSIGTTNQSTSLVVTETTSATPMYIIDLDGWQKIRINITTISGSLTVNGYYGQEVGMND